MKSDELYTAAFLAALPVCLERAYRKSIEEIDHSLIGCAVEDALTVASIAREKWLAEKEKARRRGSHPK